MQPCPNCGDPVEAGSVDNRVEWEKSYFECENCGTTFERHTVFQCQSSLVSTDEIIVTEMGEKR